MAPYIEWHDSYAVGVEEFDSDHQHLIGIAKKIIAAAESGDRFTNVRDLFDDLIEEAVVHFDNEERIMRDVNYPELAAHQAMHNQLIRTYIKYKSELKFERLQADDVAGFMIDWLIVHIKTVDLKYREFLNSRGIR